MYTTDNDKLQQLGEAYRQVSVPYNVADKVIQQAESTVPGFVIPWPRTTLASLVLLSLGTLVLFNNGSEQINFNNALYPSLAHLDELSASEQGQAVFILPGLSDIDTLPGLGSYKGTQSPTLPAGAEQSDNRFHKYTSAYHT